MGRPERLVGPFDLVKRRARIRREAPSLPPDSRNLLRAPLYAKQGQSIASERHHRRRERQRGPAHPNPYAPCPINTSHNRAICFLRADPVNLFLARRPLGTQVYNSPIFARYADQFVVAYVFGSVAAGTADEHSDIDVIVVRHTTQPFFDRLREIMELRLEFGAADMLIYTPDELEQMLAEDGRYFEKQAVRTGYRIEGTQQRARSLAQTIRE